jgi:hypothetical protein
MDSSPTPRSRTYRPGPFERTILKWSTAALTVLAATMLDHAHAAQETGITIEAVDQYYYSKTKTCDGWPSLNNNVANVDNFRNRMLSISGYTAGARWTDPVGQTQSNVWVSDFTDPERVSGGDDTHNFDRPGDAIAYFSGHGICDDQTDTYCYSQASCPDKSGLEKRCLRHIEPQKGQSFTAGRCVYSMPRIMVLGGNGKSLNDSTRTCPPVDYSSGGVAWGEDPSSGAWAGTGTNGGVNFVVIDNSCGITPDLYYPELINAFAGVSTIALIMPTRVGSDAVDVSNRGRAFADRYVANRYSAVAPSWTDAINSVTDGSSCAFGGGNHGIAGCGAHIAISVERTEALAEWANATETWEQLHYPANDALGKDWMVWIATCNYDCNKHPWVLP